MEKFKNIFTFLFLAAASFPIALAATDKVEVSVSLASQSRKPASERDGAILRDRLCPIPKDVKFFDGVLTLRADTPVNISTAENLDDGSKKKISDLFSQYWKTVPNFNFSAEAQNKNLGEEGCKISIGGGAMNLQAVDFNALRQSLKTLRQLAEKSRDEDAYVFPSTEISDFASLKFRGVHLCLFVETPLAELEKLVRLASYYKFNYVVIEPWGVFPFKSHPEFAFQDKKCDREKLKKIIDLCRDLGLTPIPQFSILGHAAQCRENSFKHAVLSAHPELADIYEPNGWSYCMSNPKTKAILKDLIAELLEFYGNPPFFHVGCDEAFDMGTCYKCRRIDLSTLLADYLNEFDAFIKSHGARTIIWSDYVTGEYERNIQKFSKDIIIDLYDYSSSEKGFGAGKYLQGKGFDVLLSPWLEPVGIYGLAKAAKKDNLFGYLETTWNEVKQKRPLLMFYGGANAAWNGGENPQTWNQLTTPNRSINMLRHMITVDNDSGITNYEDLGGVRYQRTKDVDL